MSLGISTSTMLIFLLSGSQGRDGSQVRLSTVQLGYPLLSRPGCSALLTRPNYPKLLVTLMKDLPERIRKQEFEAEFIDDSGGTFTNLSRIFVGSSIEFDSSQQEWKHPKLEQIIKEGKTDTYFSTIGIYINIDDFNNQKALERDFGAMLDKNKFYWNWQNNEARKQYRDIWSSSEQSFNDLKFIAGALIINRIASVINAVRLVSAFNKQKEKELSWNVSVGVKRSLTLPTSLTLNFQTIF
ncbi:MAG: hypothetical protein IIB83_07705 [Bacteroidetes bacterium]|nr:hypothetical protein [Bacteroidota bacterium]